MYCVLHFKGKRKTRLLYISSRPYLICRTEIFSNIATVSWADPHVWTVYREKEIVLLSCFLVRLRDKSHLGYSFKGYKEVSFKGTKAMLIGIMQME